MFVDDETLDPRTLETLDDLPGPMVKLYTVYGCPLMTRVQANHPYFDAFYIRDRLAQMDRGQIITGHCGGRDYLIERVQ